MSAHKLRVLSKISAGRGRALDLGGGTGDLQLPIEARGYAYVNVDIAPGGGRRVGGDAHRLPFRPEVFDVVLSSDSLEHFTDPGTAVDEVRRVLRSGGSFIIWVPFMHPFHGNDYFRYTPIGLRLLLERAGFEVETLEAPLWVFSVVAQALIELLRRLRLDRLEVPLERAAAWLDARFARLHGPDASFAAAYLVVARPAVASGSSPEPGLRG